MFTIPVDFTLDHTSSGTKTAIVGFATGSHPVKIRKVCVTSPDTLANRWKFRTVAGSLSLSGASANPHMPGDSFGGSAGQNVSASSPGVSREFAPQGVGMGGGYYEAWSHEDAPEVDVTEKGYVLLDAKPAFDVHFIGYMEIEEL